MGNLKTDNINHYLLNSDDPIVKVVASFIYLASLTHSNASISLYIYKHHLTPPPPPPHTHSLFLSSFIIINVVYAVVETVNVAFICWDETISFCNCSSQRYCRGVAVEFVRQD